MTDKELFLKYNLQKSRGRTKDAKLDEELFKGVDWHEQNQVIDKWLLLLHASYNCNLNCIYCEHHKLRENHHYAVMEESMIRDIIRKLGPNLREVTWHGGEPTLLPEKLFLAVDDEKKKGNFNFKLSLQTNAVALTDKKLKFYTDLGIQVGSSFDGLNNTNSRGLPSTNAVLDLIKRQNEPDYKLPYIGFICVNTEKNIDKLIDNYEYFKSLNQNHYQSCIVRENVIDATNPYLIENNTAVDQVLKYIEYWMHDTNNPIDDSYINRQIGRIIGGETCCEENVCVGGWLIIEPNGMIGTCGMDVEKDGWLNINDITDYRELLTHPQYTKTITAQKRLTNSCKNNGCIWYNACYGGCMGLNYEQDHTYHTINARACEYTRHLLDGIYELIKDIDLNSIEGYNPNFIKMLKDNNYYSLTECKQIEETYKDK